MPKKPTRTDLPPDQPIDPDDYPNRSEIAAEMEADRVAEYAAECRALDHAVCALLGRKFPGFVFHARDEDWARDEAIGGHVGTPDDQGPIGWRFGPDSGTAYGDIL